MDAIEGCGWATLLGGQNRNRLDRREARACRLELVLVRCSHATKPINADVSGDKHTKR